MHVNSKTNYLKNYLIRMVLLSLLIDIENKTEGLIFVASVLN